MLAVCSCFIPELVLTWIINTKILQKAYLNKLCNNKQMNCFCTAIGCSDLIPPEDAWLKRSDDSIVIGCYSSRQTWHLHCEGEKWIGVFGNCSQNQGLSLMLHTPLPSSSIWKSYHVVCIGATFMKYNLTEKALNIQMQR